MFIQGERYGFKGRNGTAGELAVQMEKLSPDTTDFAFFHTFKKLRIPVS
jgi:hypothetical protein